MSKKGMCLFIPPLCDPTVPLLGPYQMAGYAKKINYPFQINDCNIAFLRHIVDNAKTITSDELPNNTDLDSIEYTACLKFIKSFETVFSYSELQAALRNCKTIANYWHLMDYARACYDLYSFQFTDLRFRMDGLDCSYQWNMWDDIEAFINKHSNSNLKTLIQSWMCKDVLVKFDVIGVNITFESQLFFALLFCVVIHETNPDAYIIIGGGFINSFVDSAGSTGPLAQYCNTVFAGEGEALLRYLQNLQTEESFAPFIVPKDICDTKLDVCPPLINAAESAMYFSPAKVLPLRFSYKCYWGKCKFCSDREDHECLNANYDYKSMIDFCVNKSKEGVFDCIYFLDSAIPIFILKAFCHNILQNGASFDWGTNARFDDGFADEDFIALLSGAGCVFIKFGLESGSQRMLDLMNKGITVDNAAKTIALCRRYNILVHTYVMFAYPGETESDREATVNFLLDKYSHPDNYNSSEFILYGSAPVSKELNYSFETEMHKKPGWHSASYSFSNHEIQLAIESLREKFDNKYNPAHILLTSGHTIAGARRLKNNIPKKLLLRNDTTFRIAPSVIQVRTKDSFLMGKWRRRDGFVYFDNNFSEKLIFRQTEIPMEYLLNNGFTPQFVFDLVNEGFLEIVTLGEGDIVRYSEEPHFGFVYGNKFNQLKWYGYYDNN